jgi:cation diffusion facilitator family transporter
MTTHSQAAAEPASGHGSQDAEEHGGGHGTRAIIAALLANMGIAIAKFVAFFVTGASSMLAEAIHSVADSGNQVLLLVGGKRAARAATPQHPFGYGRDRYIYAFIVSIVLFSVGGLFAIYEGVHKLQHPGELTSPAWAIGVLLVAIVLESFSLRTAVHEAAAVKAPGQSFWKFIRTARQPELPVILLEDVGALTGLVLALLGVGVATLTGNGIYDGLGTVAIGVLLVVIAVILAIETKSLLLGESATPEDQRKIVAALEGGTPPLSVIHMKTLHLGPDEILVAAKVAVEHDDTAAGIARAIDDAERRIRDAVPAARVIYLEPDLRRPADSARSGATATPQG